MNFYHRARRLLGGLIRLLLRINISGAENELDRGACIVCSNHISMLDVFVLAVSFKRQLRYLAKAELFKIPILGSLIRALGAYSVDRKRSDVGAVKKTISLLKSGELVCIFPQGTRYKGISPGKTKVKSGAAMAAYHSHAAVQPVLICMKNYKYAPFRRVEVIVGKPLAYEELGFTGGGTEEYSRVSKKIFDNICALGDSK